MPATGFETASSSSGAERVSVSVGGFMHGSSGGHRRESSRTSNIQGRRRGIGGSVNSKFDVQSSVFDVRERSDCGASRGSSHEFFFHPVVALGLELEGKILVAAFYDAAVIHNMHEVRHDVAEQPLIMRDHQ